MKPYTEHWCDFQQSHRLTILGPLAVPGHVAWLSTAVAEEICAGGEREQGDVPSQHPDGITKRQKKRKEKKRATCYSKQQSFRGAQRMSGSLTFATATALATSASSIRAVLDPVARAAAPKALVAAHHLNLQPASIQT